MIGEYIIEDIGVANAYRRACLTDVPRLAVDSVRFVKNGSQMADEALAHRIGLVPLVADEENFLAPEVCECLHGCDRCESELTLDVQAGTEAQPVYSTDLRGTPGMRICEDIGRIELVKLPPGERLRLTATARKGTGSAHSRWSSVCSVGIEEKEDGVHLTVETDGSIEADAIMEKARATLQARLAKLRASR